jgi:hypothetical protein
VFGAHNTLIEESDQFAVWPNPYSTQIPLAVQLPNQQGAVYVESPPAGISRPLTSANYHDALDAAHPFQAYEQRSMTLDLTPGRSVTCTSGTGISALIHAMSPLDSLKVPGLPASTLPPALGLYLDRASTTNCTLQGLPGEHVVVEATAANGAVYRGLIGPTDTEVTLEEDPALYKAYYIVDPWQDAAPLDLGLIVYGVGVNSLGGPTNELLIKARVRGLDPAGTATYQFELSLAGDGLSISGRIVRVTVECNGDGTGTCRILSVNPAPQPSIILSPTLMPTADSRVSPVTGNGYVLLRIDVTLWDSMNLRVRSLSTGGQADFAPDDNQNPLLEYGRWVRSSQEGNSFAVSF